MSEDVSKDDILTKKDIGFLSEGAPLYGDMRVKLFLEYMIEHKINVVEENKQSRKKIYEDE